MNTFDQGDYPMSRPAGQTVPDSVSSRWTQRTLKSRIPCAGTGVHSGRRVRMAMLPAPAGHGIVFRRTDLGRDIKATYDNVIDTRLCTVIGDDTVRIGTIEHLLAALSGAGVDNLLIEIDGPEVPIMDGSADPFSFLLECAGVVSLNTPRKVLQILRHVRVAEGHAWAELQPFDDAAREVVPTLDLDVSIEFPDSAIGRQSSTLRLNEKNFRDTIAPARTFAMARDIEYLWTQGFAKGGSLDNAIVVDGAKVLNPGGLRMENEFAAHKLLDAVGDLSMTGAALHGRFAASRPGHKLNNKLLTQLFADRDNWSDITPDDVAAAAA